MFTIEALFSKVLSISIFYLVRYLISFIKVKYFVIELLPRT